MGSLFTRVAAGEFKESPADDRKVGYLRNEGMKICTTVPRTEEESDTSASGMRGSSTDKNAPPAPFK